MINPIPVSFGSPKEIDLSEDFQIEDFDLNQMPAFPHILIIGKRACGKTVLIDHLLRFYNASSEKLTIINPCEEYNPYYINSYPNAEIKYTLEKDYFTNMITGNVQNRKRIFVLENYPKISKIDSFEELLEKNTDLRTTFIVSVQTSLEITTGPKPKRLVSIDSNSESIPELKVSPDLASKFDYVFLFRDSNENSVLKLYNKFGSFFPNYESFNRAFTNCTKNFGIMVIDNKNESANLSGRVFRFRTELKI